MLRTLSLAIALLALALHVGAPDPERVSSIVSAWLEVTQDAHRLTVSGAVASEGYSHPRLIFVRYLVPPADSVQDVFFEVLPPVPSATPQPATITADSTIELASWVRGLRVRGEDNVVLIRVED